MEESLQIFPGALRTPDVAASWAAEVGQMRTSQYDPSKQPPGRRLLPHQTNVIQWHGSVMQDWSDQGHLRYRGLLAFHNVGAGKTAEMVGMMLMTRALNPEAMVIFVGDRGQLVNLFGGDIMKDYALFSDKLKRQAGGPPLIDRDRDVQFAVSNVFMPRYDPRTKRTVYPRLKADHVLRDSFVLSCFGTVNEHGVPAVLGLTIEQFSKMLLYYREAKRTGEATKSYLPVDFAAIKTVYLFDEAHNLQKPPPRRGEHDMYNFPKQYAALKQYFLSRPSMQNSFLVLMTATPATTVADFMEFSKLLVYRDKHVAIDELLARYREDGQMGDDMLDAWGRLVEGTIDAFQALNNMFLYPRLRFVSTGSTESSMQSAETVEKMIIKSPRMVGTAWMKEILATANLTEAERQYLGSFNPAHDPRVTTLKQAKGALRRNRRFFKEVVPRLCQTDAMAAFAPKLHALRQNLRTPGQGKHLVACQTVLPSYRAAVPIEIMLESCLGFEKLDVHAIAAGQRTVDAIKRSLSDWLTSQPRRRRYWSSVMPSVDRDRRNKYWLAVRELDGEPLGAFNLPANNEGALLELVIIDKSTLAEGTSITMLRNVHIFDVVPMDTFGQIIGRGQRPYAFAAETDPKKRVINVFAYVAQWEEATRRELFRRFTHRLARRVHVLDGKKPWVKSLKRRLAALASRRGLDAADAKLATRMLNDFLTVPLEDADDGRAVALPVNAVDVLQNYMNYVDVLRMFVRTMQVSNNCIQAVQVHRAFGMFAGGLSFEATCAGDEAALGDASEKHVLLDIAGHTAGYGPVAQLFADRLGSLIGRITSRDLLDKKIVLKAMRQEYGDEAAPAAYEAFTRLVEDLLSR